MEICERAYTGAMLKGIQKIKEIFINQQISNKLSKQEGTPNNHDYRLDAENLREIAKEIIKEVNAEYKMEQEPKRGVFGNIIAQIVVAVISTVLATIVCIVLITNGEKLDKLSDDLSAINVRISNLESDSETYANDIRNIKISVRGLGGVDPDQYGSIKELKFLNGQDELFAIVYEGSQEIRMSEPQLRNTGYIAQDINTGEQYSAEDLISQRFFYFYQKYNQNILFCGQYDENNQWDGECLTNIYQDGKLIMIYEATYDNGKLISYKAICQDTTTRKVDVWVIIDREIHGEISMGDNWNYYMKEELPVNIDFSDVGLDNLINIEKAKEIISQFPIEGHYRGDVSNGYYNDATGNAYLIKYFKDGTIRYLYKGRFVHGQADDRTGDAWDISKEENTDYMRFKGIFIDGKAQSSPDDEKTGKFKNNLTKAEIEQYLIEQHFTEATGLSLDDLRWAFE